MWILTAKQRQALEILCEHGQMSGPEFAMRMWPNNTARLTGLNLPTGRLLNRLVRLGLAERMLRRGLVYEWRITDEGISNLKKLEKWT